MDHFSNDDDTEDVTGDSKFHKVKIINYPFGKYNVKVLLSDEDKFIGISQIQINKDFQSYTIKKLSNEYIDTNDYYNE